MREEKNRDVYERIENGIDDRYINEMLETLQKGTVREGRAHSWFWMVLAAAVVLVFLVMGTMNILHHQNREDIPAQTGGSQDVSEETERGSIDGSGNYAERTDTSEGEAASTKDDEEKETANHQEQSWQSEPMYAFYNGKLYGYEGSWRTEVPSSAQLVGEGKIVQGQPEHELEVSGVPEGIKVYYSEEEGYIYDYVYLSTGYECFLLEEKSENSIVRSYRYAYDFLPETIKKDYPLPNEKQMVQWGERIKNYDVDEKAEWPFFEEELCWILNYFDVVGRGEQKLFVMLDMELQQAEKLTGVQLTAVGIGDIYSGTIEGKNGSYGYVSADTLLRLMNEGYGAQIFLLQDQNQERFPFANFDGCDMGSTEMLNAGLIYHVLFYQYNGMGLLLQDEIGKKYVILSREYCE